MTETFVPSAVFAAMLQGWSLGLALIVAIGAQNAFVLRQGLRREHLGAVVLFCAGADALLITAGVMGLAQTLGERPRWTRALALGGACFLAWYGAQAWWRARRPQSLTPADAAGHRATLATTLAQAVAFTLLNPHVYLDTVLLVGSVGAQHPQGLRVWFALGACLASALWFGALGWGARRLAAVLARPRAWQVLDVLIGATMLLMSARLFFQVVPER